MLRRLVRVPDGRAAQDDQAGGALGGGRKWSRPPRMQVHFRRRIRRALGGRSRIGRGRRAEGLDSTTGRIRHLLRPSAAVPTVRHLGPSLTRRTRTGRRQRKLGRGGVLRCAGSALRRAAIHVCGSGHLALSAARPDRSHHILRLGLRHPALPCAAQPDSGGLPQGHGGARLAVVPLGRGGARECADRRVHGVGEFKVRDAPWHLPAGRHGAQVVHGSFVHRGTPDREQQCRRIGRQERRPGALHSCHPLQQERSAVSDPPDQFGSGQVQPVMLG
mmetsp:Transcript_35419/g.112842  ORF Transcript_35419/g.112842 Transcript_35419/m.112842 type:complete len:275 (+) Transcript_35419:633-1457(+)